MQADAPRLPPGYRLTAVLAERATERVCRAEWRGQPVLLRQSPQGGADAAELAVLSQVQHEGLARLVDFGADDHGTYVAREWVEGNDLLEWARGRDPRDVGRVVAALGPALQALHSAGFVHGDLKPENVLVSPAGRPVLADFGLARALSTDADPGAEVGADPGGEEGVHGTLFALAPEVLLGSAADERSDLFALGVLMHRLLLGWRTSARAFYGRFPTEDFFAATETHPDELPEWCRDIVAALLAQNPADRPASAAAVARLLAGRLGMPLPELDLTTSWRWPVRQGREAWFEAWLASLTRDPRLRWVRVPGGESAHREAERVRRELWLAAGLSNLRGSTVDLARLCERAGDAAALDEALTRLARESAVPLFATLRRGDPLEWRACEVLAAALGQVHPEPSHPLLVVVSALAIPAAVEASQDWSCEALEPLAPADVRAFLEVELEPEPPERLEELARLMWATAEGVGQRLEELLQGGSDSGWLLQGDERPRLRPGALPSALGPEETGRELGADAPAGASRLVGILVACGGSAAWADLRAWTGGCEEELAADLAWLSSQRVVELGGEARAVRLAPAWVAAPPQLEAETWRELYARLAEGSPSDSQERAFYALAADRPGAGAALLAILEALRDAGFAERSLDLVQRARTALQRQGRELSPPLRAEEALAWCELGQIPRAERLADELAGARDPRLAALAERVRGRVAVLQHRGNEALEHYERALDLDPERWVEALVAKLLLFHAAGRDAEVVELVSGLEGEARFEAATERQKVQLFSLRAMSLFRSGEVERARADLAALAERSRSLGDAGREAAVRINLGILERRSGTLEASERELRRATGLYEEAGMLAGLAQAMGSLGGTLRESGRLVEAQEALTRAVEIRERLRDEAGAGTLRAMLGLVLADRGHAHAALVTLEQSLASFTASQRGEFGDLVSARACEVARRIGREPSTPPPSVGETRDPRVLVALARAAWYAQEEVEAASIASRAARLAEERGLEAPAREARGLLRLIERDYGALASSGPSTPLEEDARFYRWVAMAPEDSDFDPDHIHAVAEEVALSGRDDRAARLLFAVAARAREPVLVKVARARAASLLDACGRGLSDEERTHLAARLLGGSEPRPFEAGMSEGDTLEAEMDVVSLLEINHRLVEQEDLATLLGVIVDHALRVTEGERGFLVLEERGSLGFDTAHDAQRGDIPAPELEVSRSVVRQALAENKPLRVSNALDDPLLGHAPSVVSLELRSILCVPFTVSSDLRGAIYVDHRLRQGAFGERAEKLLSLLADQAALAIRQVHRLEEIRRLNGQLEGRVASREADLATARRALEEVGLPKPAGGLVGNSPAMRQVHALIERAAPTAMPVLVTGESGTGKELAARALHDLSPRAGGPFISENCAALPPSLIESELFGYRKGAFTGADSDRGGIFERAHGGTLFLDEVGELPGDLQAKLLRVLETSEVRRIGDSAPRSVDFRLVTATNRDLEGEVRASRFRADLFYRLDGLRVVMPPLSERTEDIPLLVDHFLGLAAGRDGVERGISRPMLAALCRRAWPGNVRELANEVARLCVVSDGDLSDPALVRQPGLEGSETGAGPASEGLVRPLADLEREAILAALQRTGGDRNQAAELLGVSRSKIYQRLKDWGMTGKESP